MSNDSDVGEALRRALEDLLSAEADAKKGVRRAMMEAERDALLWVGDREEGQPIEWADRLGWADPRLRVQ